MDEWSASVQFEEFAERVFRRYQHIWKPGTLAVNRSYLKNQILPTFLGWSIADIGRSDVQHWFSGLHATPAAANRSLSVLSVILREAEFHDLRPAGSNPCIGVQRYRCRGRERFLTAGELAKLGSVLTARESQMPLPVALIRLLLLTGCRQSEIRTLSWKEYREGHLFLRDSKTGPRTVWLSSPARMVLGRLPKSSVWVFPALGGGRPLSTDVLYRCWDKIRADAGFSAIRLHDLRHSYASFALRRGESLRTIGRLLGHCDPATTLRYTHFADAAALAAVELIGSALQEWRA